MGWTRSLLEPSAASILPLGETRPIASPMGKEALMGLVKRGKVWWMSFTYEGRRVRRSTDTSDKRLAEAILAKVRVQLVEGKFFENPRPEEHTFEQMMGRYVKECSLS